MSLYPSSSVGIAEEVQLFEIAVVDTGSPLKSIAPA